MASSISSLVPVGHLGRPAAAEPPATEEKHQDPGLTGVWEFRVSDLRFRVIGF